MQINIDLNSEVADSITVALLKEQYQSFLDDIEKIKETEKPLGIHSWDNVDEELQGLEDSLYHFAHVIEYFAGSNWKD